MKKLTPCRRICQRYIMLVLLIFGNDIYTIHGQSFGIPAGMGSPFWNGFYTKDTTNCQNIRIAAFYSYANSAFEGKGNILSRQPFDELIRKGFFMNAKVPLYKNFSLGLLLPWYESQVKKTVNSQEMRSYRNAEVSEIRLKAEYLYHFTETSVFLEISTGLPLRETRTSYISNKPPIGNDGYWNLGIQAAFMHKLSLNSQMFIHNEFLFRFPRSGAIFEGDTALILTNNRYNAIQATIYLHPYFTSQGGYVYKLNKLKIMVGYDYFYGWSDRAENILPEPDEKLNKIIFQAMGADAFIHSLCLGASYKSKNLQFDLSTRLAFFGKNALKENMLTFRTTYIF